MELLWLISKGLCLSTFGAFSSSEFFTVEVKILVESAKGTLSKPLVLLLYRRCLFTDEEERAERGHEDA